MSVSPRTNNFKSDVSANVTNIDRLIGLVIDLVTASLDVSSRVQDVLRDGEEGRQPPRCRHRR